LYQSVNDNHNVHITFAERYHLSSVKPGPHYGCMQLSCSLHTMVDALHGGVDALHYWHCTSS